MTLSDLARGGGRIRVGIAGLGAVAQAVHLPRLARLDDLFDTVTSQRVVAAWAARRGIEIGGEAAEGGT
jgi:predicted dehydrogenase